MRMVIGITGSAGSGKTTVSSMLAALGARTLSADALVSEAYDSRDLRDTLVRRFGPQSLREDETVNRPWLSKVVFGDAKARRDLEAVVHPWVMDRIAAAITRYRGEADAPPVLAIEIPLLYEVGAEGMVDRVLVACAPPETCAERLRARGWSEERIRGVQASQIPIEEKIERADHVVDTSGDVDRTTRELETMWRTWTGGGYA